MASYSYRTATTTDPCYVPILGDYVGAGRMRLATAKVQIELNVKSKKGYFLHKITEPDLFHCKPDD